MVNFKETIDKLAKSFPIDEYNTQIYLVVLQCVIGGQAVFTAKEAFYATKFQRALPEYYSRLSHLIDKYTDTIFCGEYEQVIARLDVLVKDPNVKKATVLQNYIRK